MPRLPRIANFDDLDPLRLEQGVTITVVPGRPLPRDADVILLPGSKSTISDLGALRTQGWDIDISAHARQGGRVLGICSGYQMLGRTITDPEGVEGTPGSVPGLGLLDVETLLTPDKRVLPRSGRCELSGEDVSAYEIHLGRTVGPDSTRPLVKLNGLTDGAQSANGRVSGTYLHGLFCADGWRRRFLGSIRPDRGETLSFSYDAHIDATLDALADHIAKSIDIDRLITIARSAAR